jgi:hypothetical protein
VKYNQIGFVLIVKRRRTLILKIDLSYLKKL